MGCRDVALFNGKCIYSGPNDMCKRYSDGEFTSYCTEFKTPTQFDHIRAMSDEELARFLWEQNGSNRYWKSVDKYLEWGRSPYKEE